MCFTSSTLYFSPVAFLWQYYGFFVKIKKKKLCIKVPVKVQRINMYIVMRKQAFWGLKIKTYTQINIGSCLTFCVCGVSFLEALFGRTERTFIIRKQNIVASLTAWRPGYGTFYDLSMLQARRKLVSATLLPLKDYGDAYIYYMNASRKCLQSLNTVYHCALRFVTDSRRLTHHCELCAKAELLPEIQSLDATDL